MKHNLSIDDKGLFTGNRFFETESSALPERKDIEENYRWNVNDIFKSEEEWEEKFKWVSDNVAKYGDYEGRLSESAETLAGCLKFDEEVGITLERLHLYAMLSKDSDLRVNKYQAMADRVTALYAKAAASSAFIRPEIVQIDEERLKEFRADPALTIYDHFFDEMLRRKAHTLDKQREEMLAKTAEMASVPYNAFSIFTDADMKFPVIKDEKGNDYEMSHGRFYAVLYSKDRDFRKRAYEAFYQPFQGYANTLATLLNGQLKTNIFNANVRNYPSARSAALDRNNIPITVYDNLVDAVNKNFEPMHRWADLKRRLLKLEKINPFDAYVSIFESEQKKYSYEEGLDIVKKSLQPMGGKYLDSLQEAFDNRWIDVFETKGKRSGAYSSGTTFGVHPYVLLNWTGTLNDVFTLTHEMGHNMHSYFTGQNQPYVYSDYTIFVAEVASTFNESLLLNYLIDHAESKETKLDLMERFLNNITATFYRQTMFAEFEMKIYELTEQGNALTADGLRAMFKEHYQRYWGAAMNVPLEEEYTWARIPHFYYNFYVYQYATGFAASEALAGKVITEGEPAVEKYLNFLKSGSSDYSINLLKNAGVDMTSEEPVLAAVKKMTQVLDEMESLL